MSSIQLQAANTAIKDGIDAMSAGQLDEARRCFEQSMVHAPDNHIALENLAAIAVKQGELAQAEDYLRRISLVDETPGVAFRLAKICEARGDLAAARDACGKAYKYDETNQEIKKYLAGLELRLSDREAALCLYRELADDGPADTPVVTAYTKLIWQDHPEEAIERLIEHANRRVRKARRAIQSHFIQRDSGTQGTWKSSLPCSLFVRCKESVQPV